MSSVAVAYTSIEPYTPGAFPNEGDNVETFLASSSTGARGSSSPNGIGGDGQTSKRNGLRSRLVGSRVVVVLWVQQWDLSLYPVLALEQWPAHLRASSLRSKPRHIERRHSATSSTASTSAYKRGVPRSRVAWSGIRRQRYALGSWRYTQRLLQRNPGSAVRWKSRTLEGSTSAVRPCVLRQSQTLSVSRGLAGLRVVGKGDKSRLRIWARSVGSNQAKGWRDCALCRWSVRSLQCGTRWTRCCSLQQRMVLVE